MRASTFAVVFGLAAVVAGAVPAAAAPSPPLQQELDRLVRVEGVPGAQAVLSERGRSREVTSGAGDLRTGQPFPHRARIRIGSNTKTFVATVVLQLVAERRVELDRPVEQYLPGAVRGDRRITVRHLLQHTSGLADYLEKLDPVETRWRYRTADELARLAMTLPPHFDPGAKWEYSNTNYVLAGLLVERVTGRPLATELNRRVILPLGLHSTYYPMPGDTGIHGPHPRGYHEVGGERVDYTRQDPSWGGAAGAMVSTGQDLNRFFTALLSGELLPPAQLAEMKRTVPADIFPGAGYGLGLIRVPVSCGVEFWGHGGSIPGFRTRGGATTDGRAVNVAVNQVTDTESGSAAVLRAVDAAVCAA
ncbi:serine hydrolase [Amycolatopsis sp. 195334CR]|uniref:serine hydrolase domain-containing protein n=1 Tax=Amycolatopsis sp. 195334CR TaxID=2814588 RepID=UPI001A906BAD|nr:serine hydrolase domain-containing protein [Amycolatopsis sp. 195334CR]MBN6035648.1 beta-lactamase family protein [Amycolatopsis sp. 195334CR]